MKTQVSEGAVAKRLDRFLWREQGRILKRCAWGSQWFGDLGRYYAVDANNHLKDTHINLEEYARESGVLRPDERMVVAE